MTEFMRSTDAFTWAMESDPRLRSTVVTVLLLDKSPDWDEVRHRIDLIDNRANYAPGNVRWVIWPVQALAARRRRKRQPSSR